VCTFCVGVGGWVCLLVYLCVCVCVCVSVCLSVCSCFLCLARALALALAYPSCLYDMHRQHVHVIYLIIPHHCS